MDKQNSESEVEILKKRIEQLENLQKLKDSLRTMNVPTCQLCMEPVECPVTFNNVQKVNGEIKYGKCAASQANPTCLMCAREYVLRMRKQGKQHFNCLYRCCTVKDNKFETYGEIGRKPDDVPEPTLYRQMRDNGVTVCRRCHTDCITVYDLAMHIKNTCPERMVTCKICKKDMKQRDLDEHAKSCYFMCLYCGIEIPILDKKKIPKHQCMKKPLFKCKFCNYSFNTETIMNFATQGFTHNCSRVYKTECVPCNSGVSRMMTSTTNAQGVPLTVDDEAKLFTQTPIIIHQNQNTTSTIEDFPDSVIL
jgi:hypothetical protein